MDLVFDVGHEYNPTNNRFDHHQKGFEEHFFPQDELPTTKLSSAGLIYKHFGKEIIRNYLDESDEQLNLEPGDIDHIHKKLYKTLVLEIDAMDNGVS